MMPSPFRSPIGVPRLVELCREDLDDLRAPRTEGRLPVKYLEVARLIVFAIAVVLGVSGASAQQPSSSQELIDGIIQDVINRTVYAARQEVRRNTGIDRDSPDGSSQSPTMVAQWASERDSGPELSR